MQISHSRVESYLLCPRKDYYGYELKLRRKKESASLGQGTAGHACLAALYRTIMERGKTQLGQRRAWKYGVAAMWAKYHELVAEGYEDRDEKRWTLEQELQHYVDNERLVLEGYRILAVEKEFHVRWNDEGDTMIFVVDLIVRDPQGRNVVVDHKFVWDFYTQKTIRLQPQIPKYVGMLRFLGYEVSHGMYNMVRTRRLQGGKLLKAELVDALYNHFGEDEPPEAMEAWAHDLPKLKVEELQRMCDVHGIVHSRPPTADQLLRTEPVECSDVRVRRTLEEQFAVAETIIHGQRFTLDGRPLIGVRVANKMICQSCSYRELCDAELNGDDTRMILEEYDTREARDLPELDGEDDE